MTVARMAAPAVECRPTRHPAPVPSNSRPGQGSGDVVEEGSPNNILALCQRGHQTPQARTAGGPTPLPIQAWLDL